MQKLLRSLLDVRSTSLRSPHLMTWESKAASQSQSKQTAIWDTFDYGLVEGDVQRVYGKIVKHEKDVGRYDLDPTDFVLNPEWRQK